MHVISAFFKRGKYLGLAAAVAGSAVALYGLHRSKDTYVLTAGSFLKLDYPASIAAFQKIAAYQDKKINITPALLQAVYKIDDRFKRGDINAKEFRSKMKALLNIECSDEEFDGAWNAMLGDTFLFKSGLQSVKELGLNVVLISGTNSIHADKLGLTKKDLPVPVFLSYQQRCLNRECYERLMERYDLTLKTTTLVLREQSGEDPVSQKTQALTDTVEAWAESAGLKRCHVDTSKGIVASLQRCAEEQLEISRGIRKP